jgi:uncharacterized membrane protein
MAEPRRPAASLFVRVVVAVIGVTMIVLGLWGWLAPESFAELVNFPVHVHFLHDAGVFQIGIGVGLLAALAVRDALVVVLVGFLVANTLHAINHGIDLPLGGHVGDMPALAGFSVLAAVALYLRVRQLRERSDHRSATYLHT